MTEIEQYHLLLKALAEKLQYQKDTIAIQEYQIAELKSKLEKLEGVKNHERN